MLVISKYFSDSQDLASKINEGGNEVNTFTKFATCWQIFGFLPS